MKISFTFLVSILMMSLFLLSCKEKNEIYPPVPWSYFFYSNDQVKPRPISAILIENDHSQWFGSLGAEGIAYNNGYEWMQFGKADNNFIFDSVTAILRDGNGLLWVGCRNGIACYNGNAWQVIEAFRGKKITAMLLEGIGSIWVGLDGNEETGGIATNREGSWKFYTPSDSQIPSSHITCLALDQEQRLFAGTADKGLIEFNGNTWNHMGFESIGISATRINAIASGKDGKLWMGTTSSYLLDLTGDSFHAFFTGTAKPITSLRVNGSGEVWIGTSGAGLIRYQNGTWNSYTSSNMHLPTDSVLTLGSLPLVEILVSYSDGHIIKF